VCNGSVFDGAGLDRHSCVRGGARNLGGSTRGPPVVNKFGYCRPEGPDGMATRSAERTKAMSDADNNNNVARNRRRSKPPPTKWVPKVVANARGQAVQGETDPVRVNSPNTSQVLCYNCGKPGHKAARCRSGREKSGKGQGTRAGNADHSIAEGAKEEFDRLRAEIDNQKCKVEELKGLLGEEQSKDDAEDERLEAQYNASLLGLESVSVSIKECDMMEEPVTKYGKIMIAISIFYFLYLFPQSLVLNWDRFGIMAVAVNWRVIGYMIAHIVKLNTVVIDMGLFLALLTVLIYRKRFSEGPAAKRMCDSFELLLSFFGTRWLFTYDRLSGGVVGIMNLAAIAAYDYRLAMFFSLVAALFSYWYVERVGGEVDEEIYLNGIHTGSVEYLLVGEREYEDWDYGPDLRPNSSTHVNIYAPEARFKVHHVKRFGREYCLLRSWRFRASILTQVTKWRPSIALLGEISVPDLCLSGDQDIARTRIEACLRASRGVNVNRFTALSTGVYEDTARLATFLWRYRRSIVACSHF